MWTKEDFEEMKEAISQRITTDPYFWRKCWIDPNAAIEEISGIRIEEEVVINFDFKDRANVNIVLKEFHMDTIEPTNKRMD